MKVEPFFTLANFRLYFQQISWQKASRVFEQELHSADPRRVPLHQQVRCLTMEIYFLTNAYHMQIKLNEQWIFTRFYAAIQIIRTIF